MLRLLVVAAALLGCGTDDPIDPGPDGGVEEICTSSTLPQHRAAWDACRSANVDSVPVFCDPGEVLPPCAFATTDVDGNDVQCRPAGVCE